MDGLSQFFGLIADYLKKLLDLFIPDYVRITYQERGVRFRVRYFRNLITWPFQAIYALYRKTELPKIGREDPPQYLPPGFYLRHRAFTKIKWRPIVLQAVVIPSQGLETKDGKQVTVGLLVVYELKKDKECLPALIDVLDIDEEIAERAQKIAPRLVSSVDYVDLKKLIQVDDFVVTMDLRQLAKDTASYNEQSLSEDLLAVRLQEDLDQFGVIVRGVAFIQFTSSRAFKFFGDSGQVRPLGMYGAGLGVV